MPLFSYNGRSFKFYLVNLPEDVNQEITKMIVENGGEIVDIGDPPIINFSVPDNYVPGKVMYNVQFIKDCVRWGELGDLHKYKLGPREAYDGCIMSLFMYENPSCIYRYVKNPCLRKNVCAFCGSGNVTLNIVDETHSSELLKTYSGTGKVIKSKNSHNKGGGDATKDLKSTNQRHLSHFDHETEEASSTYQTAQDSIHYSPDSNLLLTQATQNQIDELHTDSESIITIHNAKEEVQLNSESPRSLKRADGQVEHKSPLNSSEIIYMTSDSESDESGNSGKRNDGLRSQFRIKIDDLPDMEFIQVPTTISAKQHKSHIEVNKIKKEAATDDVASSKLKRRSLAAEKKYKENEKNKSRIKINPKYKNGLSNHDEGRSLPLINPCFRYTAGTERSDVSSDEDEEYPKLKNGKSYGRRDGKKIIGKSKKGKNNAEKSCAGREDSKCSSLVGEETQPKEDSTDSVTDPEGIFTNIVNKETSRTLRVRKELPNSSYIISDDDLDDDDKKVARLKTDKSPREEGDGSKHDNESDRTVNTSDMEISDDSAASDFGNVKKSNTVQSHARSTLHIDHRKNGKRIRQNVSLQEWLVRAKRKAESMEAPQKRNFAKWEKWRMLIFLIEHNLIEHAKGLDAWQYMLQNEKCGQRTKMSLNNHFLKFILPCIEEFRLPKDIEKKFLTLRRSNT